MSHSLEVLLLLAIQQISLDQQAILASNGNIHFDGETTFINNSGESGTALYLVGVTVEFNGKSFFVNNTAVLQGGALYTVNSKLSFSRAFLFSGNHAGSLGGAIAAANSSLECTTNGTFLNNLAMEGGGLSLEHDSIFSFLPTVTIKFSNNTAQ